MESDRITTLASIGLAASTTSPALLHAIRGCLHDVTMLTALLQPELSAHTRDKPDATKSAQRLRSIDAQIGQIDRNVALLAAMIGRPAGEAASVCATARALPDVVRLLKDEAVRQRVRFEHDLDDLPPHIAAPEPALQRALLASGAWVTQHAAERSTIRLSGREHDGHAIFEFEPLGESAGIASDTCAQDVALLEALATAAGGRLDATPALRLVFPRASGPSGVSV